MRKLKPWWLWLSFITGFLCAMWAEELIVHRQGDELHISAPELHFIAGHSLEQLQDGASVSFNFQLTLWTDSRTRLVQRSLDRFVVSYDLWEEKFSVVELQNARKKISHLTAATAEAWCMDNISVSTTGISNDQKLWLRLEVRAGDRKSEPPLFGDSGLSLNSLIEIFSRKAEAAQPHWTLDTGPFRLGELKASGGRGS